MFEVGFFWDVEKDTKKNKPLWSKETLKRCKIIHPNVVSS